MEWFIFSCHFVNNNGPRSNVHTVLKLKTQNLKHSVNILLKLLLKNEMEINYNCDIKI